MQDNPLFRKDNKIVNQLVRKNVRKYWKDYLIYFWILLFEVCFLNVFYSISLRVVPIRIASWARIGVILGIVFLIPGLTSIFTGAAIARVNRMMACKRKAEFEVYVSLGMKYREQVALMMKELQVIAPYALAAGLAAGIAATLMLQQIEGRLVEKTAKHDSLILLLLPLAESIVFYLLTLKAAGAVSLRLAKKRTKTVKVRRRQSKYAQDRIKC